jgi:hypothetical protein
MFEVMNASRELLDLELQDVDKASSIISAMEPGRMMIAVDGILFVWGDWPDIGRGPYA